MALEKYEGIPKSKAVQQIWMKDSKGLIIQDRPEGGISEHKAPFAQKHPPMKVNPRFSSLIKLSNSFSLVTLIHNVWEEIHRVLLSLSKLSTESD